MCAKVQLFCFFSFLLFGNNGGEDQPDNEEKLGFLLFLLLHFPLFLPGSFQFPYFFWPSFSPSSLGQKTCFWRNIANNKREGGEGCGQNGEKEEEEADETQKLNPIFGKERMPTKSAQNYLITILITGAYLERHGTVK